MLIKKQTGIEIPSSEITTKSVYLNRRRFMKGVAAAAAGSLLAACTPRSNSPAIPTGTAVSPTIAPPTTAVTSQTNASAATPLPPRPEIDELGDPLNTFEEIANYNNYYEFTLDKEEVAQVAAGYPTSPWQVEVGGLVRNPGVYDIDDLRRFDQEERIYRLRCVEAWSMVIPWLGFPLAKLLNEVEPTADAKFVRFETINDPTNMPGQRSARFEWPYVEGLRLDEAMHDLTLLATGIYGEEMLPQNGAPIRLVVPWKYGFKSIKSIVRIDLAADMPRSLWMAAAANEYGFYANVNPDVDHPRWSQGSERRIGQRGRRRTIMFNGYEEQAAHLYDGLDLRVNY